MLKVKQFWPEYKVEWVTVSVLTSLVWLLYSALSKEKGTYILDYNDKS